MKDETETAPDAGTLAMTRHLAAQVKRIREAQNLPITKLSERMAALGKPIARLGLTDIEKGKRKVDVDELAALAKALGVPPLLLILPVGAEAQTEILPGYVRDTWDAAKWFTGEAPLSTEAIRDSEGRVIGYTQTSEDFNEWYRGARSLELMRTHERLLMEWRMAVTHTMSDLAALHDAQRLASTYQDPSAGQAQVERLREMADKSVSDARDLEKALLDHRRHMQQSGMVLPDVPELRPELRSALAEHGLQVPPPSAESAPAGWVGPRPVPPIRDPSAPEPSWALTPGARVAEATMAQIAQKFADTGQLPGDRNDTGQEGGQ